MSIAAASSTISSIAPPPARKPMQPPAFLPKDGENPTATGKPGPAPLRQDFTSALQALLLRTQAERGA